MKTTYWVIFREDPNTHEEVYVRIEAVDDEIIVTSVQEVGIATHFDTARIAYNFGGENHLDNWRVGLR